MKKQFTAILILVLIAACLMGCGKNKYEATLGNWEIQTYAVNGIDTDIAECEYQRMSMADDGTFVFINGSTSFEGTYDVKGSDITAELGDKNIKMKLTNNSSYITVTYESGEKNYILVFKKVSP